MATEDLVKFFSEMGYLKRLKHNGLMMAGVQNPDSIAEHSFRTAIIGYFLAEMEGADKEKVAVMCLFHDVPESRVGDQNKVSARYFETEEAENTAFGEQIENLPAEIMADLLQNRIESVNRSTKEGIVAKDADWLETAMTAKEYLEAGHKGAQNWIDNVEKALETESAKEILKLVKETDFTNFWWQGLKKMTYKKMKE